jgi:hypothetical protein
MLRRAMTVGDCAFPESLTDHERQFVKRIREIARQHPNRYRRPGWLWRNVGRFIERPVDIVLGRRGEPAGGRPGHHRHPDRRAGPDIEKGGDIAQVFSRACAPSAHRRDVVRLARRYRRFESIFLQRRVCKPSVPRCGGAIDLLPRSPERINAQSSYDGSVKADRACSHGAPVSVGERLLWSKFRVPSTRACG